MATFNLGVLLAALEQAKQQWSANAPLAAPPASQSGDITSALTAAQPLVAKANAFVLAHPGAVTAVLTVVGAFKTMGYSWATEVEDLIVSAPGLLATANTDLPMAVGVLKEFTPAPFRAPDDELWRGR